jgi:restriction system protein
MAGMARRTRKSGATDVFELVSLLPWWAGVALALLSFALLNWLAERPVPANVTPGQLGSAIVQIYIRSFAMVGQYVAPVLFLAAAGASAWRRRRRQQLFMDVTDNPAADALQDISWQEFEQLIGEAFRLQGYQVAERAGAGADGGVDLVLTKDGEKQLVQCKQWRAFKVGVEVVRELYGVMAARGSAGGFVVTSGRFTSEAQDFARGRNIKLVDGPKLQSMLRQVRSAKFKVGVTDFGPSSVLPRDGLVPTCPLCSRLMTRRVAGKGVNAGKAFWGCTGFPACRGMRPVDPGGALLNPRR